MAWESHPHVYFERFVNVEATEVMIDKNGNPLEWHLCHPAKLLQYMVATCPRLQDLYAEAANRYRGEWSCVVTFDEFVPGNKLKTNNWRKAMSLCFNFLEIGRVYLSVPCTWMFPVCVRTSLYKTLEGGWSHMCRLYLEKHFLSANAFNTSGVPLILKGEVFLCRAQLSNLASDGDGLRAALSWKGASSLRPCWRHSNVTKRGSDLCNYDAGIVDICCTDPDKFKTITEAEMDDSLALVEAAHKRWLAGRLTKDMYEQIEKSKGLTYNSKGLMWDPRVRPLIKQSVVTMDWPHSLLCDGSFSTEVYLFLQSSERLADKGFADVATHLKDQWTFPAQRRGSMKQLHLVFNDFRCDYASDHERLKASASELLAVYGLVRHWIATEVQGVAALDDHVASFHACCETVDICQRTKRGQLTMQEGSRLLKEAAQRHLALHIRCYGTEHVKPKHHWVFDIALQWLEHQLVIDAFIIEKEHLRAKVIADRVDNTSQYERTVLAGMMHAQVDDLNSLGPRAQLLGRSTPYPGFPDALVSDNLSIGGVSFSVGDFVFRGSTAGQVVACIQEDGDFYLVVDPFALVARLSNHSGNFVFQGGRAVWGAEDATPVLAWKETAPYTTIVLQ